MSTELIAALIGAAVAVVSSLLAQAVGAHLTNRRRSRELASRFLARLKSVGYLADSARYSHANDRQSSTLLALEAQTEAVALGAELEMICPRRLRGTVRAAVNGAIETLAGHNSMQERQYRDCRAAFDGVTDEFNRALVHLLPKRTWISHRR